MIVSILTHLKKIWETWNIQAIILFSLSLQVILILFAPLRKRSANTLLIFTVWSAYLLADWAAAFAVGHISVQQANAKCGQDDNGALFAFWTPFLLVHLGGPDTITAFALEDNTLWLRHLLNLVAQLLAAIYVFYLTLPKNNKLLIPTLLMLAAGVIKYGERIRALYLGNLKRFKNSMLRKPDPGLNYAKLMDGYSSLKHAMLPASIKLIPAPNRKSKMLDNEFKEDELNETEVVKYGYDFFEFFKGLIVDITFTFHDHRRSREFFQKRSAADALEVISVELNFMYEILYTKVLVVHSKWGYFFRIIASSMVIMTLVLFTRMKKHQYHIINRMVTYALLYGAIALDVIALSMLIISDRTVAYAIQKTSDRKSINRAITSKGIAPFEKTSNQKRTSILDNLLTNYASFMTRWNRPGSTTYHVEPTIKSKVCPGTIFKKFQNTKYICFVASNKSSSEHGQTNLGNGKSSSEHSQTKLGNEDKSSSQHSPPNPPVRYQVFNTRMLSRRWSESICAYNLLYVCLKLRPEKTLKDDQKCHWWYVLVIIAGIPLVIPGAVVLFLCLIGWSIVACCKRLIEEVKSLTAWDTFVSCAAVVKCLKAWDTFVSSAAGKWETFFWYSAEKLGVDEALDSWKYVSRNPFLTELWDFIYHELLVKSMFADDTKMAKEIYEAKGNWVLQDGGWLSVPNPRAIMDYVEGDYDRIVLIWHIATELCYNMDDRSTQNNDREFSKILSDYIVYLLIKQPTMMSNVAGISYMRFRDTCAEAKKFFERKGTEEKNKLWDACRKILRVDTSAKPFELNGYKCKSVLFEGCHLAKELRKRGDKWKMMSRVWVELLAYAAGHCRAETHVQVLSKGGELITFVWLLMAHLGIVEQLQINDGHARAKLLLDP